MATTPAEKAAKKAEQMKPRECRLPSCRIAFVPSRPQDWKSEFCSKEHRERYWLEAHRAGAAALQGSPTPQVKSEYRPGVSQKLQVLEVLRRNAGQWVEHPRQILPGVVWNSRIADLRHQGYRIETRRVGLAARAGTLFAVGGKVDYQYRLVKES